MNRILFSKVGMAKYISHLDLMRTMQRAFIRAGLEIRHTQGFNPHPHMVFGLPLPVGCESECEVMDFELVNQKPNYEIVSSLNKVLPEGIKILEAYEAERKLKELSKVRMEISYIYDDGANEEIAARLRALFDREEIIINKKTKKGFSDINIKELIDKIEILVYNDNVIKVDTVIAAQNPSLNPLLLTAAIQRYEPELAPSQALYMRRGIYDINKSDFR